MKLEGSLETFPLRELIDMGIYSSVIGVLNIYSAGETGRLYFRDGSLYHAERGTACGIEALAQLLELRSADFSFVSDVVSSASTLDGHLHHFLQTAERLATRWRQIRPYVPTMDLVPRLLLGPEAAQRRTSPANHAVLSAIDGQATLRQLAVTCGWAEIDLAESVVQLCLDGVAELQPPHTREEREEHPLEQQSRSAGLFDRIRAQSATSRHEEWRAAEQAPRLAPEDLILRVLRSSGELWPDNRRPRTG